MKRDEILGIFAELALSQGFYGRLLRDISEMEEEDRDTYLSYLEEQNFTSELDLILFIEC